MPRLWGENLDGKLVGENLACRCSSMELVRCMERLGSITHHLRSIITCQFTSTTVPPVGGLMLASHIVSKEPLV
ncbi:hypothetical protein MKW98_011176 [Papaver atlanticum]|uniref:Uncharacterized protein n=1 Tax=Papaver atlanticum TaxID=357466 RepID=A0AAD4TJ47_9MAGN|nr:hypothetical protein MKW98_011176 [Papaver atlanticum]